MHATLRISTVLSTLLFAACGSSAGSDPGSPDGGSTPKPDGGGTTNPPAPGFSCTTGTLFAGHPAFDDPSKRPADGTGLREDPPFPYRMLVFSGNQVISHDGEELWRAALADGKLHKVAGTEQQQQALITGRCGAARFANLFGIAAASDGSLFLSDQTANTILKVTNPLTADCTVSHYAGTPNDIPNGEVSSDNVPNVGNHDDIGSKATFGLPERPAVDADNNVYVWDRVNDSIRKIATDADHTVSTLVTHVSDDGSLVSLAVLGGQLYIYGLSGDSDVFITGVDLATKERHDVVRGRADKFGGGSSDSSILGGIVTDGTGLIVFYNGQLFYVTTAGAVSAPIAGVYAPGLDFSSGYDPAASHPAAEVEIPGQGSTGTAGAEGWLAIDADKNLYVTGMLGGSSFVEKLACTKR